MKLVNTELLLLVEGLGTGEIRRAAKSRRHEHSSDQHNVFGTKLPLGYFNSQFESGTLIFLNKLSVPVVIKEVSSMTSATR